MTRPTHTPAKKPFTLPTKALEKAIDTEWEKAEKFNPKTMPFTSLAFTAIDRITGQEAAVVESLLVYIDTDAICYRSMDSAVLEARQKEQWDPIITWIRQRFDVSIAVTSGVMPLEQPEALSKMFGNYLKAVDVFRLTAAALLAGYYNSVCLAIAALDGHVGVSEAFTLSQLEETYQIEQWGRDEEAQKRTEQMAEEVAGIARFLKLLDAA